MAQFEYYHNPRKFRHEIRFIYDYISYDGRLFRQGTTKRAERQTRGQFKGHFMFVESDYDDSNSIPEVHFEMILVEPEYVKVELEYFG